MAIHFENLSRIAYPAMMKESNRTLLKKITQPMLASRPVAYWERLRDPQPPEIGTLPGSTPLTTRVRIRLSQVKLGLHAEGN
jgi:hypothetical protein